MVLIEAALFPLVCTNGSMARAGELLLKSPSWHKGNNNNNNK